MAYPKSSISVNDLFAILRQNDHMILAFSLHMCLTFPIFHDGPPYPLGPSSLEDRLSNLRLKRQSLFNSHQQSRWIIYDLTGDMDNSFDIVKKAFEHRLTGCIPRGELWLGTDLFKKAKLEDNLQGHLALIKRLGQDFLCLPLSNDISMNKALGYRYFSLQELEEASRMYDLFIMALIDGPFQRLAEKRGLMNVLTGWKRERHALAQAYENERAEVDVLIGRCLELSIGAVIIADDVAGERAPFVDPDDIQDLLSPFYTQAVSEIHSGHAYALFHSCGNITMLIPQLISYGFDGLAAIQHRTNDLISLKGKYGSRLTFMAGIDAEILGAGEISLSSLKEYERLMRSLSPGGGFILCSCSGFYAGDFLERVQELYRIADELFNG